MLPRQLLLVCILVLIALMPATAAVALLSPAGANQLYVPQIVRAEPALSEIIGLASSRRSSPINGGPDSEIYTLRADGSTLTRLTDNDWEDSGARWSPDGAHILWNQYDFSGPTSVYNDLWLMDSDGSNARSVAALPGGEQGTWAPTSDWFYILENDDDAPAGAQYSLYVTTPTMLTPTLVLGAADIGSVRWSPTGDHLAFMTVTQEFDYFLYTVAGDGSNMTLAATTADQLYDWSPDGAWLAFGKESGENRDVYVARPDGTETLPIATSPDDEYAAGWVEEGARLLVQQRVDKDLQTSALLLVSPEDGTTTTFAPAVPEHGLGVTGVSPDGKDVVYLDVYQREYQLMIQATDSLTATEISPLLTCGGLSCGIGFGGWSHDESRVAYSFGQSFSPSAFIVNLYVANLGSEPTYQLLVEGGDGPHWLPFSSWLSAIGNNGHSLELHNPRTGEEIILPLSPDQTTLFPQEWRYAPSK